VSALDADIHALFALLWIIRRMQAGRALVDRPGVFAFGIARDHDESDGQQYNEASHESLSDNERLSSLNAFQALPRAKHVATHQQG
jgi:hypothetical protein